MNAWLESTLSYWQAGGPLLIPLAIVHILIWTYFLHLRRYFISLEKSGDRLTEQLAHAVGNTDPHDTWNWMASQTSGLPALLNQIFGEIRQGSIPSVVFDRYEERARRLWRRDLVVLAALTSVAPLLGLLGTIAGMIYTFHAVYTASGDTASRVAEGISTALITTQFGLVIAIPGLFGMARLRRLIRAVEVRLSECRSLMLVALGNTRGEVST